MNNMRNHPKPTAHQHVDASTQTSPSMCPAVGPQPADDSNIAAYHPTRSADGPAQIPHPHPYPSMSPRHYPDDDEAWQLEAEEKRKYRFNMRLLAEAVRERIEGRGRHALLHGRLYDATLAESFHCLEKLVGCFVSVL